MLATQGRCETPASDARLTPIFALTSYSGGRTFLTPQALCVDSSRGDVYVADTNNGRIVVFNSTGQFLMSFNHRSGPDQAAEPVGVAVAKSGRIFVTDSSSHVIYIYDFRGRPIGKISPAGGNRDELFGRMAVDGADNLYVTVRNKGQVYVYDADGALKLKIGATNDPEAKIEMVCDVALDAQGRIYALSSLGTPVHVFSPTGSALFRFGKHAAGAPHFAFPTAIDVDAQGRIWIIDSFAHCVKVFTNSGSFLTNTGGFFFPADVAIWPKEQRLFVLEKSAQRLSGYAIQQGGSRN